MTRLKLVDPPIPEPVAEPVRIDPAYPDRLDVRRYRGGIVWTRFPEHVARVLRAKALKEDWCDE